MEREEINPVLRMLITMTITTKRKRKLLRDIRSKIKTDLITSTELLVRHTASIFILMTHPLNDQALILIPDQWFLHIKSKQKCIGNCTNNRGTIEHDFPWFEHLSNTYNNLQNAYQTVHKAKHINSTYNDAINSKKDIQLGESQ